MPPRFCALQQCRYASPQFRYHAYSIFFRCVLFSVSECRRGFWLADSASPRSPVPTTSHKATTISTISMLDWPRAGYFFTISLPPRISRHSWFIFTMRDDLISCAWCEAWDEDLIDDDCHLADIYLKSWLWFLSWFYAFYRYRSRHLRTQQSLHSPYKRYIFLILLILKKQFTISRLMSLPKKQNGHR